MSAQSVSPLRCHHDGLLLGQLLMLVFAPGAGWPGARRHVQQLLAEHGIDEQLPDEPIPFGGERHTTLVERVLVALDARSKRLRDLAVLGTHFVTYPPLAASDVGAAAHIAADTERIVRTHGLPPVDLERLRAARVDYADPAARLAPGLDWLAPAVVALEREPSTAMVIAPASQIADAAYVRFTRPALERAGYRPVRPWSGLAGPQIGTLRLALLSKMGVLVADVSAVDADVLHQIGAAHALGVPVVLVRHRGTTAPVPSSIDPAMIHDYDLLRTELPWDALEDLVVALGVIRERTAVAPSRRESAPGGADPALEAQSRGLSALEDADLPRAAAELARSIDLGLDDAANHLALAFVLLLTDQPERSRDHYAAGIDRGTADLLKSARRALTNVRASLDGDAAHIADSVLARMARALETP